MVKVKNGNDFIEFMSPEVERVFNESAQERGKRHKDANILAKALSDDGEFVVLSIDDLTALFINFARCSKDK